MPFFAPWFLAGLLALGVPLFVHLLRKHVATPQPVSSLMFFERGTQSSTKHRRLKYLLLFTLRFLLVLLVVLAFAQPYIKRSAADANGRLLLIVLDRSFSMRAGTRFADAKQQALALLAAKPASQRAQVMALGGQLALPTQATTEEAPLRTALEGIEAGDGHGSLGELGRALAALSETVHEPIDLHLFSDLQRTSMPGNFADMVLPENVTLVLHPAVKGAAPPNWTVESVDAPAELADPKDPKHSRVKATVAGFNTPAVTKAVSLLVNGKVLATRTVPVPANGQATVEFAPLELSYGVNRCEVRVGGGDGFAADDASVFAVRRSDPERVLFVHPAGETRSTLYFGAALEAATQGAFLLQSVSAEQATDLDPGKFAYVVLADTESLPSLFERALNQYVANGGNVLLTLGTGAGHGGRLPLWSGEVRNARSFLRDGSAPGVAQVDFTYPALAEAQPGRDNGGWADIKFFFAADVDPAGARVAAKFSDGAPLLLDRQLGEGHVVLFASGMDNVTNDLPLHPVFVAFVDRLTRSLSGNERLSGARLVDAFVQLRANENTAANALASVEVIDPQGRRPLSLSQARTAQSVRLEEAGFYQLRLANGREAVIGVNPDRRESNLEPIPDDVLALWIGSNREAVARNSQMSPGRASTPLQTRPMGLWWYVMLLALVVAIAEKVLGSGYLGVQRENG